MKNGFLTNEFSGQAFAAGVLAAFVGFASSFAVILRGLSAVGATQAEAASGLMALSIAMGVCAILLSLRTRQPISIAWSTPGAALLATSGALEGAFATAVGAFLVTGALIVLAGSFRVVGRWVAAIPAPLANAMLAGVLLSLCLAPVRAVAVFPASALAIIGTWAVVGRWRRLYAVPAAVLVTVLLMGAAHLDELAAGHMLAPHPVFVMPHFSLAGVVGIAVPLFIVTMASQNIPGLAVLAVNGYQPRAEKLFRATGWFTIAGAFFGGHAVNLAAITAALCAGPDAHPDPARRYWAAVTAGFVYILFGLLAGMVAAFVAAVPPVLVETVAGLALLGAFASAVMGAVQNPDYREAAVITFLVSGSGLSFLGIGGAFWGLLAGLAMLGLARLPLASIPRKP